MAAAPCDRVDGQGGTDGDAGGPNPALREWSASPDGVVGLTHHQQQQQVALQLAVVAGCQYDR
jgi:hypothetical protein